MERNLYRHYFSEPQDIYVALSQIDGNELDNKKQLKAKIVNLSGGGASIKTELDFPVKKTI
jgi:hypothetical protein